MNKEKKKQNFKKYIHIQQNSDQLTITGTVHDPVYKITELCFTNAENKVNISIPNQADRGKFNFDINIEEELNELAQREDVYRLDMIVQVHKKHLTKKEINKIRAKASANEKKDLMEYSIRMGRFEETVTGELNPANIKGKTFALYKTIKGNLSLAVNKSIQQKLDANIKTIKTRKDTIQFSGKLFTQTFKIQKIELLVSGREHNRQKTFPVNIRHLQLETQNTFGLNHYEYKTVISLKELFNNIKKDSDIYEVFFKVYLLNKKEPTLIKVGKPNRWIRNQAKMIHTTIGDNVFTINIYYTYKMAYLCLQVEDFTKTNFKYLIKLLRWRFLLRPFYKKKDIWLIGEHKYKAQDNGYHFFKYVRAKYPDKNAYYVITEDSLDRKKVDLYGNVVYFKSKEHIKTTIFANKVMGSHHAHFLYPLRTDDFKRKLHAKNIFLQHGVLGVKNLEALYSKHSGTIDTDLMIVSSDKEKKIVKRDFGYKENEIAVTGLSRFDNLFEQDIPIKRQILIIPTWREWLLQRHIFLESDYLKRYKELIYHPKLQELSHKYQFEIVLCLHPNMQHFTEIFNNAPCRVVNQGEVDVQDLLKESMMMITDYSSVAFDFSFLEKPIIYYQFDRKRFLGKAGSHLNLDTDLPGDIVYETPNVLEKIEYYAENEFQMKPEYKERASKFIKYKDRNSSERIYDRIDSLKVKRPIVRKLNRFKLLFKKVIKKVYNRFVSQS